MGVKKSMNDIHKFIDVMLRRTPLAEDIIFCEYMVNKSGSKKGINELYGMIANEFYGHLRMLYSDETRNSNTRKIGFSYSDDDEENSDSDELMMTLHCMKTIMLFIIYIDRDLINKYNISLKMSIDLNRVMSLYCKQVLDTDVLVIPKSYKKESEIKSRIVSLLSEIKNSYITMIDEWEESPDVKIVENIIESIKSGQRG